MVIWQSIRKGTEKICSQRRKMRNKMFTAFYDMDSNRIYAWITDRSIVTIDYDEVEKGL